MDLHFISTGPFGYVNMLSVYTAAKTHKVEHINLWYTVKPEGVYFDAIKDLVKLVDVSDRHAYDIPALRGKDAVFQRVHMKDHLQWLFLSIHGGLYLDLDTISVRDVTSLLEDDKVIFASLDVVNPDSIAFPFNNAVVCVRPPDRLDTARDAFTEQIMTAVVRFAEGKLQNEITWGDTGPIALSTILNTYRHSLGESSHIQIVPHEVLCPWGGNEIQQVYREDGNLSLPKETGIIHLFAKASGQHYDQVNADWVKRSNSFLATMIKTLVPPQIWMTRPGWSVEEYLQARGRHYQGLFDLIRGNQFKNIMEIGTSSGDTAIGMIRAAGEVAGGEEKITYTGIDLFELGTPEKWEEEFSGGYRPPSMEAVKKRLNEETRANIILFAGDSRKVQPYWADPQDLIYIDGGHSIETVRADWWTAQHYMHDNTAVVFDDYFPEMSFIGCKAVVDSINRKIYKVTINPITDDYKHPWGRLRTQLVLVRKLEAPEAVEEKKEEDGWAKDVLHKVIKR